MSKSVEEKEPLQNDEATKFFLGARSALKIGDMGAAERLLRRSLDLAPKNYLYMLTLARLLVQMDKNSTESEALLIESSNLKIDAVEPRLILSAVYEKQGRLQITQSVLKSVINIDPTNFIAKRKLSQLNGEIPEGSDSIKLRQEVLAQALEVDNADLPLITPSTTLVQEQIHIPSLEENLSNISKIPEAIIKETLLNDEALISSSESSYIGLSERLAVAELLALDSAKAPLEEQKEFTSGFISNNLDSSQSFAVELPQPVIEDPAPNLLDSSFNNQDIWSSKSEDTVIEILRLEADYLLAIVRDFFFAVKDQLDEGTAFLLLKRSKQQIEPLYPELDYFEVYEDHRVVEFIGGERYVSKRTLESVTTWMYLLMILLKETSYLRDEAREKALEQAFPKNDDIQEERLFRQYFNEIQL